MLLQDGIRFGLIADLMFKKASIYFGQILFKLHVNQIDYTERLRYRRRQLPHGVVKGFYSFSSRIKVYACLAP